VVWAFIVTVSVWIYCLSLNFHLIWLMLVPVPEQSIVSIRLVSGQESIVISLLVIGVIVAYSVMTRKQFCLSICRGPAGCTSA